MGETYRIHRIKENWGIIIAIIFIASTLRAPLTSVGPVVSEITEVLKVSDSVAGSLITIPLIIFCHCFTVSFKDNGAFNSIQDYFTIHFITQCCTDCSSNW